MIASKKIPSVRERMIAALENPQTTESQTAVFVDHLKENLKDCRDGSAKSFLAFLGTVAVYTLLVKAQTTTFTVAGVEIARTSSAIAFIPTVAAFCFYRSVVYELYSFVCAKALLQYYRLKLPTFHENSLSLLTEYPSVLEGDDHLRTVYTPLKYRPIIGFWLTMSVADYWDMLFGLSCVCLPFIWFFAAAYWTAMLSNVPLLCRIIGVLFPGLLYARSALLIVGYFKH